MTNVNYNTMGTSMLGKDEQSEGALFIRFLNPTDFDAAFGAMRLYIKDNQGFLDEYKYLGLFGGPLKDFIKRYIEASYEFNSSYSTYQKDTWYNYFATRWNYSFEELDIYFGALVATNDMGKIPRSIFSAYTYKPSKDTAIGETIKDSAKYIVYAAGAYAVGYLLLREFLFGTKRTKKRS